MSTRTMDPTIKALSAIKRDIRKIVGLASSMKDKLTVIEFGERELAALREELVVSHQVHVSALSAAEKAGFGDLGKI